MLYPSVAICSGVAIRLNLTVAITLKILSGNSTRIPEYGNKIRKYTIRESFLAASNTRILKPLIIILWS